jgi:hypothetical protein
MLINVNVTAGREIINKQISQSHDQTPRFLSCHDVVPRLLRGISSSLDRGFAVDTTGMFPTSSPFSKVMIS